MIRNIHEAKPGSAWDTWRQAGRDWRAQTWATTPGALLLAANCFATGSCGSNEREAMKRAFIEGATNE